MSQPPTSPSPESTAVAAIELVGLSRRYGEQEAAHDLTLSVPAGEILGLLAPTARANPRF